MSSSGKYVAQALLIFRQEGLRLSMDALAAKMGITKKTLYNNFANRDELIARCVGCFMDSFASRIEVLTDQSYGAAEAFREGIRAMREFFGSFSPIFLHDLKRFYPEMAGTSHRYGFGMFEKKIEENIRRGKEEGAYRFSLDEHLMSKYISYSIFSFFINNVMRASDLSAQEYFDTVVDFNLRGLENR